MRTYTGGENTVITGTQRKTWYRVDVADPDGVMQDMGDVGSLGWLKGFTIDEHIDQPVAGMTVRLQREARISGGYSQLSPLRTDSPVNTDGPAVDVYRRVKAYVATVTGSRPSALSTDWKLKFDGVTDRTSEVGDELQLICRDKGAYLIDQWIFFGETRDLIQVYFNGRPQTLEAVINALLLYAPIDGAAETCYVPTDPGYIVTSFPLKFEPVMTACQRAAELAVCDFRYAWHEASGTYKPTLSVPDRTPSGTMATFASSQIVGWQKFDRDRLGVRNSVYVQYQPKTSTVPATVHVSDATSITDYGHRVIALVEDADSSIDSSSEATTMANLILADLKDAKAEGEIEMLADWRIELNDYDEFSENKFFDIAQELAVIGIRHELDVNRQCTYLTVRGTPSAGYRRWIERARKLDELNPTTADNGLTGVAFVDDDTAGTRTYTWVRGANVAFIAFYETLASVPLTVNPWPAGDAIPGMVASGTAGASIFSSLTDTWVASKPARGKQRFGMAVPYYKLGGRFMPGDALKMIVDPLPSNMAITLAEQNDPLTDGDVDLALLVFGSSSDWPVTAELWIGPESGAADYTYTVSATTADADAGVSDLKGLALLSLPRNWSAKATNVAGEIARSQYRERYFAAAKYVTIPGSAFVPRDSALTEVRTEPGVGTFVADPGSNPIKAQGSVAIPFGAGISLKTAEMYCKQEYSVAGIPNLHQVTVNVIAINRTTQAVTTIVSLSTSSSSSSAQQVADNALSHTVDPETYAYYASVKLADPNASSTALELWSLRIGYTQNTEAQGT